MKRLLFAQLILLSTVILSLDLFAQRPSQRVRDFNTLPSYRTSPAYLGVQRLRAPLNLHSRGRDVIRVKQEIARANPGIRLEQMTAEQVVLIASSAGGRAQATLLINGRAIGQTQIIPRQETRLVFDIPHRFEERMPNTLQIEIHGNVFTRALVLFTEDQWSHEPDFGVVRAYLNKHVRGYETIFVKQEIARDNPGLPLNRLSLESVMLTASSHAGRARATLIINGQAVGRTQIIDQDLSRLIFPLPRHLLGTMPNTVQIDIQGTVFVKTVALETYDDFGHGGGWDRPGHGDHWDRPGHGGYMQTQHIQIHQQLRGKQILSLQRWINLPPQAQIHSIEVLADGIGNLTFKAQGNRVLGLVRVNDRSFGSAEVLTLTTPMRVRGLTIESGGRIDLKSLVIHYSL